MKKAVLLLVVLSSACVSTASTQTVTVTDVVDGDTMDIQYENGRTDTVRLLGVDTPEVRGEVNPDEFDGVPDTESGRQCLREWAHKASDHAETLNGKNVTLRQDSVQDLRGDYGRVLGYIESNGSESFNYELIEEGYARVYESRFEEKQRFLDAESGAQGENRGLWECVNP